MPAFDFVVDSPAPTSARSRQLETMFDVPRTTRSVVEFKGALPIEEEPWSIGLIVGPSGCGKSTLLNKLFEQPEPLQWRGACVLDDFPQALDVGRIAEICQAVGFNTIPAWLRPFGVLSNGEKFRVELARRLIEPNPTIVMDEFTSVVDRQVAQIGAHAVQKYVRKHGKRFVAATCHYDIIDWLQPDWVFEPATMTFTRRSLRRRPPLSCSIVRAEYSAWALFSRFHYLTADLHRSARCYVLTVGGQPAAFAGLLHRPSPNVVNIMGVSRLVTLPDWQGLGLAFVLVDRVAALYAACGKRVRTYPAHPALVRAFDRSIVWALAKAPGLQSPSRQHSSLGVVLGARPCAIFEYSGDAWPDVEQARGLTSV